MPRCVKLVVCLAVTLSTGLLSAQTVSTTPTVAFVYVSSGSGDNNYEINAFTADASGRLSSVQGSPFPADVQYMAVNGKYLFGTNGVYIYSFSVQADGALQLVSSINAQQLNGGDCGGPGSLFLDHTGATLYDEDIYGNICANNAYQSFSISPSTGVLTYLGMTGEANENFWVPLGFIANNQYAYGSYCYHFSASIFGFQRNSDGTLNGLNIDPPMPVPQTGNFYCPYLAAEDSSNNLAISVQQLDGSTWQPVGPPQLATYTADSAGNLTTNSTFSNMPGTAVQVVTNFWMAPSGKLLAVAGKAGLQIFHFNGSHPITRYTGLLTQDEVDQLFWDNDNHLYAISRTAGKLFVFTVTPTSVTPAPGSPYTVGNAQNIIVLPKT